MRWLALVMLAGGTAVLTLHCGLGIVGEADQPDGAALLEGGSLGDVVVPLDGPSPSFEGGNVVEAGGDAGCECLEQTGWDLVRFAPDRTRPCNDDFETEDRVTAIVDESGCSCGACAKTPPTCTATKFKTNRDDVGTPTCNEPSADLDATGCTNASGALKRHSQVIPPPPSGGSCTSTPVMSPGAVKADPIRICRPKAKTCACGTSLGPAFEACLVKKGDQSCPAVAPVKTLVAESAQLECGGCACTLDNRSCFATVDMFKDPNCVGKIWTLDSLTCQPLSGSIESYRWSATGDGTCNVKAVTAKATIKEAQTICCP